MEEKKTVEMSVDELAQFKSWQAAEAQKREAQRVKEARAAYAELVDDVIELSFPMLQEMSDGIISKKKSILSEFQKAIEVKSEVYGVSSDQFSHTFTNSAGDKRIVVGYYMRDNYRDTVNEGIAKVQKYIESLAKDADSQSLVNAVLRLLARDQNGTIKASRVLQLRKMAEDSGNAEFLDGVRIIEDSYQPVRTANYVRAQYKDDDGKWQSVPLSMTDC